MSAWLTVKTAVRSRGPEALRPRAGPQLLAGCGQRRGRLTDTTVKAVLTMPEPMVAYTGCCTPAFLKMLVE